MCKSTTWAPEKGVAVREAQAAERPEGCSCSEGMAAHEGLVRWVVRQQWLGDLPFEDALHEGRLGLWRALCRFDPSRGTSFSTYAVPAITHAVWRAVLVHHRPPGPPQSLPLPNPPDDRVEVMHRAQVRTALLELVDHLPPRLRHVIVAHYGLADDPPQTFAAIGATLGLTRQRIQQLHAEALLWLAHPGHSLPLRRLLDRHQRSDYLQALARQRHYLRKRRHPSSRGASVHQFKEEVKA